MDRNQDLFDWLREIKYNDIWGGMAFFGLLLGLTAGPLAMIVLLIGLPIVVLKFSVEIFDNIQLRRDKAQRKVDSGKHWGLLKSEIVNISNEQYFQKVRLVLNEIDFLQSSPKQDLIEHWNYLNEKPEVATRVYLKILSFVEEEELGSKKARLLAFALLGLSKLEGFEYIFKIMERTADRETKKALLEGLVQLAYIMPTSLVMVLLRYIKDYRDFQPKLMNAIMSRAQEFNKLEIQQIVGSGLSRAEQINFFRRRTTYFYEKGSDASVKESEKYVWFTKIVEDFGSRFTRPDLQLTDEDSGSKLAFAYLVTGDRQNAIFVSEHVLNVQPSSLPAVVVLVAAYEALGNRKEAKNVLIGVRKYLADNEWGQTKLNEYNLV